MRLDRLHMLILILFLPDRNTFASINKRIVLTQPTVILVSYDGFRWDYMEKVPTPNLNFIASNGIKAKHLLNTESFHVSYRTLWGKPRDRSKYVFRSRAQRHFLLRCRVKTLLGFKILERIDFLKVVRLVFWSGVVGPGTSFRSLALRAHSRATRSKARLVSKSMERRTGVDHESKSF